jgi:hypothetical protein
MQASRYVVFMDPNKMQKLRDLGLQNFSGWVNKKVDDYIQEKESNDRL